MKIGFDAKWFFDGPPSGRMVVTNQAAALAALDSGDELYLFLDCRAKGRALPFDHPRLHCVYLWAENNLVANTWNLTRAAQELNLDVVICQNFTPPRARFARVAFIYDVIFETHPEYYSWKERLYFTPLKALARRAERICTLSAAERERMIQAKYGRPESIDVVHLGVGPEFRPRGGHRPERLAEVASRYGLPGEFLLFVGRLNVRKNIQNLLRALPMLRHRQVPLVVAGAPDWRTFDLEGLIEKLGIRGQTIFTGALPPEDLGAVYALSTVFCFPSYEEGFGLPPLEAMASGIPVVVSDRPVLREVCGDAGTYAAPEDPAAIARAIDSLLENRALIERKGIEGVARAKLFTWERAARAVLASAERAVSMQVAARA